MKCANTISLNNMLNTQEAYEIALDNFHIECEPTLTEIRDLIESIKLDARSGNYDFTDEVSDMIKDLI